MLNFLSHPSSDFPAYRQAGVSTELEYWSTCKESDNHLGLTQGLVFST